MSFVFSYFVSMRYFLLVYLRRCVYLAHRMASQHPAPLVLLKIAERNEIRR